MSRFTLTLAAAAFALAIASPPSARAGSLAPKKPSELVTLTNSGAACPVIGFVMDTQSKSDGTSVFPFVIPAGAVLVLTSLDWDEFFGPASTVDNLNLSLQAAGLSFLARSGATLDAGGTGGASFAISGTSVKPGGTPLCVALTSGNIPFAVVHGFLAKDN